MKFLHLLYGSVGKAALPDSEIFEILSKSRINNSRSEITGLLLFRSNKFLQMLEGPEASVRNTYERITKDLRHKDAKVFLEFSSDERIFPVWNMGYPEKEARGKKGEDLFKWVEESVNNSSSYKDTILISALKKFNCG